jgi:putative intracellular protease/amidase
MKDGSPHPTGFWAREFIEAHDAYTAGGLGVSIATPFGVKPTVDQLSWYPPYNNKDEQFIAQQKKKWLEAHAAELDAPLTLEDIEPGRYDVVYVVGGHGPMQDLAVHLTLGNLLVANLDDPARFVGAVCHRPASFLSAHRADGTWAFKGRKVTSFTNEEETQATSAGNAPWLLEDRLRLAGALFQAAEPWSVHIVGGRQSGHRPAEQLFGSGGQQDPRETQGISIVRLGITRQGLVHSGPSGPESDTLEPGREVTRSG